MDNGWNKNCKLSIKFNAVRRDVINDDAIQTTVNIVNIF